MIIRLCTPIYTYSPIHFRKIDMTTKNSGGFIRFHLPPHSGGGGWCRANECSIAFLHLMVQTQMKLQETYPKIWEKIINGNIYQWNKQLEILACWSSYWADNKQITKGCRGNHRDKNISCVWAMVDTIQSCNCKDSGRFEGKYQFCTEKQQT